MQVVRKLVPQVQAKGLVLPKVDPLRGKHDEIDVAGLTIDRISAITKVANLITDVPTVEDGLMDKTPAERRTVMVTVAGQQVELVKIVITSEDRMAEMFH